MLGSELTIILLRISEYPWQNECNFSLVYGLQEITMLVNSNILPVIEGLPDCHVELDYHARLSSWHAWEQPFVSLHLKFVRAKSHSCLPPVSLTYLLFKSRAVIRVRQVRQPGPKVSARL